MSPSDPTPLAQRLVHVAAQAMYGAAYGKATKCKAALTVSAALRELADDDSAWFGQQQRGYLRALADSIEKGAE